jgi:multicomponent K+:H+ antiporter subunit F
LLTIALNIFFAALAISFVLCLVRLVKGPDLPDRILALDTLYVNAVSFLVALGIRNQSPILFEAALLIALMGFVGTVALTRFLARGDVID